MEGIAPSTFEWLLSYNKISYYQHHEHVLKEINFILYLWEEYFFLRYVILINLILEDTYILIKKKSNHSIIH
uniref:Uncharacterized protein n=1 Tax=Siphoviridae sp. cteZR38 TaxID=2827906 RepID=A0A8S5SP03_9CAUD|nr:MAG TPA: hypothetical protein [Siphoviridae sp. cteZR38]